jgi:hypothetical protein
MKLQTSSVPFEKHLYDDFISRLTKSNNKKALDFVAFFDVTTMGILCNVCNEVLPVYCFGQCKNHKHGINMKRCTKCYNQITCPWKRRWQNMVTSTKRRNKKGRCHGNVEYSPDELRGMFHDQGGKCYISGNDMAEEYWTGDPYSASVERLDNKLGYVKGNVVLICQYLQVSKGDYSPDEIRSWFQYDMSCDKFMFNDTIFNKPIIKQRKYRKSIMNGDKKLCTDCDIMLPLSSFSGKKSVCNQCNNIRMKNHYNTPYGFVMKMTNHAKQNAKIRGTKRRRNDDSDMVEDDLFTIFVETIKQQGGRCAITGIPFVYEANHKFAPSVDRLDDSKGYVSGNVRMIIVPLNTRNNKIN